MMSQIAVYRTNAQRVQVVLPAVIGGILRHTFMSAGLRESQLCKLTVRIIAAFFTLASFVHNPINMQQNQSENQILLLWRISCIFAAVQLVLTCWLIFVIVAPLIQLLLDLPAWMCYTFGSVFNFLDTTVMCYLSVMFIFVVALGLTFHALRANEFRFTDRSSVLLMKIWSYAGGIFIVATFCPELCRTLISAICWLGDAAGVLIPFALRLIAVFLGVGAIIVCGASCVRGRNYGNFLRQLAACSVVIISSARRPFSSAEWQQSQLWKLTAITGTAFSIFISVLRNSSNQQNQTASQILLSWSMSCIFTAVQLPLTCWLIFVTAPGIQFVFDLAAWLCYTFGSVFSYLVGTVACFMLVVVIFVGAMGHAFRALWDNEFRLTDPCRVELRKIWLYIWIAFMAVLCTETCGRLIEYVTVTIYWFDITAGVLLNYLLQLIAICLGVGGIMLSVLCVYYAKQLSDKDRLCTKYGHLQETVR